MKKSDARKKTEKNEKNTKKHVFSPKKTRNEKNGFFHNPRHAPSPLAHARYVRLIVLVIIIPLFYPFAVLFSDKSKVTLITCCSNLDVNVNACLY